MKYDFTKIERHWQGYWAKHQTFHALNPGQEGFDPSKPKFFVLDMFPYPSGVGLHVGHPLGYIATDIVARYKRMNGFAVLHPMGYDAFGLPAEQFAVEHNVHPRITTEKNIANMTRQLKELGLSYDWDRCFATTDPGYYRWTQWIFLKLFNSWFDPAENRAKPIEELVQRLGSEQVYVGPEGEVVEAEASGGIDAITGAPIGLRKWHELSAQEQRELLDDHRLAYVADADVNWCPELGTVLANEEVTQDGRSERGNYPVYKRPLRQWMLRITAYAPRLLDGLESVDWPEPIKIMQRNWIGRSEGAMVDFAIDGNDQVIRVYTTRPDTLFGATYLVLAPEHPLADQVSTDSREQAVTEYRRQAQRKTDLDRTADASEKTGVFTGGFAINPVNGEKIPIWIADYVLMGYGTGAIMAVPAHDQRDFEFATVMGLPIRDVVYSPVLAAIKGFADYVDPADSPLGTDRINILADYIGVFLNQPGIDYVQAGCLITRRKQDKQIPPPRTGIEVLGPLAGCSTTDTEQAAREEGYAGDAGQTMPVSGDRRGAISSIWLKELQDLVGDDFDALMGDIRGRRMAIRFGAALQEEGISVNSTGGDCSLDGQHTKDAMQRITDWLTADGSGKHTVQFKLRDWLFSRQRYWGEPFPIAHDQDGQAIALAEDELPVELPQMEDFKPERVDDDSQPPRPPLGRAPESWRIVQRDGAAYQRELNTMPQWAGSCWYYLRFCDPHNGERFVGQDAERYWMGDTGVDLYVGGAEHAVLHLLYSRFWHHVLYDLGQVGTPEPYGKLFNQGYIQAYAYTDERGIHVPADEIQEADGQFTYQGRPVNRQLGKMGKSLKNSITPDEIREQYGCDTLRLYEMYLGPLEQSKVWRTHDIVGVHRFLQRLWRNFVNEETGELLVVDTATDQPLLRKLHKTIKRVTDDMRRMSFHTAIAAMIELNNDLVVLERLPRDLAEKFVLLLSPLAPHIAEQLWLLLGHDRTLAYEPWPTYDDAVLTEDQSEYPVQVNGKLRGRVTVPADAADDAIERAALAHEKVRAAIGDLEVKKVVVVKGRMVNIVAK